jgi:two-component system, chemotaxis family, protein-glutamate methylesterase/glutaminase
VIKVLVVDDSPTARTYLTHIINSDPAVRVIDTACNGEEALKALRRERPDVITMDINMPRMNGLEATRRIMEESPVPVIIVTASWDARELQTTFLAIEAGALAAIPKPEGIDSPNYEKSVKELISTIRLMSEIRVVKRWPRKKPRGPSAAGNPEQPRPLIGIQVIAIGASTGGPAVIHTILSKLPESFSIPILIVQHMARGFVAGFADWLGKDSALTVGIAAHGEYMQAGHVYVAPDDFHLGAQRDGQMMLSKDDPESNLRPSVSYLFRSVARSFGGNALGIILTGMGKDGAEELKLMQDNGAVTIAQDKESSVVFGMPGEAVNLKAAAYVLPPDEIAEMLAQLSMAGG